MKKLILLLLVTSCSVSWVPTIRSPYSLTTHNGFIVTNIYTNPTDLEHKENQIGIKYDIIVKNIAKIERSLDLNGATMAFRETTLPMTCQSYQKEVAFKVQPDQTFRIQCEGVLDRKKNLGDTKMILSIPLEKSFGTFTYVVRSEDFQ